MADNKFTEAKINQTLVLKKIRRNPGISRINISRELGLNRSTITHIVNDLLSRELIGEITLSRNSSQAAGKGGRKPVGLELNPEAGRILGVEWQIGIFRYVLLDLSGNKKQAGRIPLSSPDVKTFLEKVKELIPQLEKSEGMIIQGAGFAMPGRVDPHKGLVLHSLPFNLKNYPLASVAEELLGIPVLLDNDANCFAWRIIQQYKSEYRDFLCLILEFHNRNDDSFADQEIGMGLVQNGTVYYGARYSSGELNRPLVPVSQSIEFLELINDPAYRDDRFVREYLGSLFQALRLVISVLDPERIFLGGEFTRFADILQDVLDEDGTYPSCIFSSRQEFEIAHGGASHFMEILFSPPLYEDDIKKMPLFWDRIL